VALAIFTIKTGEDRVVAPHQGRHRFRRRMASAITGLSLSYTVGKA